MKLQTRSNIFYSIYSILIFIVAGIILYGLIRKIYYHQVDDSITTERLIIKEEIERLDTVPDYTSVFGHRIEVSLYLKHITPVLEKNDTVLYNVSKHTLISYRHQLYKNNRQNGLGYSISIMKPLNELNRLSKLIYGLILVSFTLLQILLIGLNYLVNQRLWNPFYHTLHQLEEFNIESPTALKLPQTKVAEFRQLNRILTNLSHKLKRDFFRMQEFTENLSHEINTMLAVIIMKIELLLQNDDMTAEQIAYCKTIYQVSSNLSRLNNSLQILTKIDNQFYTVKEEIDMEIIVKDQLVAFSEFIEKKNLEVNAHAEKCSLLMNRSLAEVLISNVVGNAIKHNIQNGFIKLYLQSDSLVIENSGQPVTTVSSFQFARYKNKTAPEKSLGLGLAIVKRICRLNGFTINRSQVEGNYQINIRFNHSLKADGIIY
jgi:signal transduction histidine kinase